MQNLPFCMSWGQPTGLISRQVLWKFENTSALVQKPKNLSTLDKPQSEKPHQYPPIINPPGEDDISLSGSSTSADQSSLESDHSSPSNLLRQPPGYLDWAYWVRIPASNEFFICEIGYHVFISWYDDMTPYLSVVMDYLEDFTTSDEQRAHVLFKIVVEGVVRVYNRYVLWEDMIWEEEVTQRHEDPTGKAKGRQIRREDELLHFALAVRGKIFQLYVFQPIIKESRWGGCRVKILAEGDLTIQHHTEQLINDIDKVHKWADALYMESISNNLRCLCPDVRRSNRSSGV